MVHMTTDKVHASPPPFFLFHKYFLNIVYSQNKIWKVKIKVEFTNPKIWCIRCRWMMSRIWMSMSRSYTRETTGRSWSGTVTRPQPRAVDTAWGTSIATVQSRGITSRVATQTVPVIIIRHSTSCYSIFEMYNSSWCQVDYTTSMIRGDNKCVRSYHSAD